jgi:hypothetical protein
MSRTANAVDLTVYLVGVDADDAATSLLFTDYPSAARHADDERPAEGDPLRVFTATAVLDLAVITLVDDRSTPTPRSASRAPRVLGRHPGIAWISRGWSPAALLADITESAPSTQSGEQRVIATWDGAPERHQPVARQRPDPTRPGQVVAEVDVAGLAADLAHAAVTAGVQLREPAREVGAGVRTPRGPVWHCSLRHHPDAPPLSDQQWAAIVEDLLHRTGIAPRGDLGGCRWVVIRHAEDHIHVVAVLVRQDTGQRVHLHDDRYWARTCLERWGADPEPYRSDTLSTPRP